MVFFGALARGSPPTPPRPSPLGEAKRYPRRGLAPKAAKAGAAKNNKRKNHEKAKNKKKQRLKKKRRRSKTPAPQRGLPPKRRRPGQPKPPKKNKKRQESQRPGSSSSKSPGKAKHLHFKGVGPKSGEGPGAQHHENEANQKTFSRRPKSFWFVFLGVLARGSFFAARGRPGAARERGWPQKRRRPGRPKQQTKKTMEQIKKQNRGRTKIAGEAKRLRFRGVCPQSGKGPGNQKPTKKTRKSKKAKGREARAANPRQSKTPALQRGWPEKRRRPGSPTPRKRS